MNLIERSKFNRRVFNPKDSKDVADYRNFVTRGKWDGGCPFFLDWPYLTIPDMIKDRLTKNLLKV